MNRSKFIRSLKPVLGQMKIRKIQHNKWIRWRSNIGIIGNSLTNQVNLIIPTTRNILTCKSSISTGIEWIYLPLQMNWLIDDSSRHSRCSSTHRHEHCILWVKKPIYRSIALLLHWPPCSFSTTAWWDRGPRPSRSQASFCCPPTAEFPPSAQSRADLKVQF